jgi:hypothetical protein
MLKQDYLIRDLAAKYKKDPRVIESIVYSPFKFLKTIIEDPANDRSVRLKYFGVFTQKPIFNKNTRVEKLLKDLRADMANTTFVMVNMLQFPVKDSESVERVLKMAEEQDDYEKIKLIWDAYKSHTSPKRKQYNYVRKTPKKQ